jgi:carboxypeptidase C (cathepsin A)
MTPSNSSKFTTPEDFRVYGLENVEAAYSQFEGKMYAGMLPSDHDGRTGMTMFWMFEPETQLVPDSLVLWMNGGPGCSSFNCGVLMEHSPVTQPLHDAGYCCLKTTPKMNYNEHAWTRATTMLYVEHPIGTGFSYGHPYPETEQEASSDLDAFLQNFYNVFTHLKKSKFYVFGESYAGMFVPSVARYIHRANLGGDNSRFLIPLAGAALGNGWINVSIKVVCC